MYLCLGDSVRQAGGDREQRREEPQPPPQRPPLPPHHLVTTESAVAIERSRDAAAVGALMQLQPAVGAARFFRMIEHHRWLVAARAQAGRDERQRRKLHASFISR